LWGVALGGIFAAIGFWLVMHGIIVSTSERYRQPVFFYSGIAVGVVLILVSLAPARLIIKMTALKKYRPYKRVSLGAQAIDQTRQTQVK